MQDNFNDAVVHITKNEQNSSTEIILHTIYHCIKLPT